IWLATDFQLRPPHVELHECAFEMRPRLRNDCFRRYPCATVSRSYQVPQAGLSASAAALISAKRAKNPNVQIRPYAGITFNSKRMPSAASAEAMVSIFVACPRSMTRFTSCGRVCIRRANSADVMFCASIALSNSTFAATLVRNSIKVSPRFGSDGSGTGRLYLRSKNPSR
ncbi:MAG: hypothetical protein QOG58_3651, partial [Caballeronia sp.]|nr:hypothetical protein [Caballeronia sp.]